ncbi:hypothetical protein Tco_0932380 [Tanacetum coccineum]
MKSKQDSPKTPHGSPPPPPPPPPPYGASRASGTTVASDSAQDPLPPPPSLTPNPDNQFNPSASSNPEDVFMHEESDFVAPDMVSDDKDIGRITELMPEHLEGPAYEVVKAFHPDVIHLQYQMEECHKLLTNQVYHRLLRYDYMKQIVLRRVDNQEYTIAKNDFKDLYPSDFEDLNLVIRQRVEDFQIGIESYQTQLNLTKPRWEATGLKFMHDYKILDSPRAVVFRDKYGMQMIMRFNEIHKFSDETLQQIDEALDYQVKEFRVNKVNPGLNTRFWTTNDVIKSKQFMFAIQKRLKLRRIFRNLESFVGGRIREGDYRLLQRTE